MKKNISNIDISKISIIIEKCKACLNNDNYIVTIKEKESQEKVLYEYFIKIFRNKKENKILESEVQKILGENNLGPKLLEMNE